MSEQMSKQVLKPGILCTALATLLLPLGCGDDDGSGNDNQGSATICGNGVLEAGEACDEGSDNSDIAPDACRTDCRSAHCGDNVLDSGEECDDGAGNSDRITNACRHDCRLPHCGDGVVDGGEQCDDGDTEASDGCDTQCAVETNWRCAGEPSECACVSHRHGTHCAGCRIYVDRDSPAETPDGESWATAYPTLREAMAAVERAGDGCEVWVAEGVYPVLRSSPEDSLILPDRTGIYGGFAGDETERSQRDPRAHVTQLSGHGPAETRVYHVVTAIDTTDATLDGLVVTGGSALGNSMHGLGGGLLATNAHLHLADCVFFSHEAKQGGAVFAADSEIHAERCRFSGSATAESPLYYKPHGGCIYAERSAIALVDTSFLGCLVHDEGSGGALYLKQSPATLRGVSFSRCVASKQGGGLYANIDSPISLEGAVFVGNQADRGGGIAVGSTDWTLVNALLLGNEATYGGGIYSFGDGLLINATVAGNEQLDSSTASAGGIDADTGSLSIMNSIFWDNQRPGSTDAHIAASGGVTTTVTYTDLPGYASLPDYSSPTNLYDDPRLYAYYGNPFDTGQFEDLALDESTGAMWLIDDQANWTPGELAGAVVRFNSFLDPYRWTVVHDNTADAVILQGPIPDIPVIPGSYSLYDLRLAADSPCIDRGNGTPDVPGTDLRGKARVDYGPVPNQGDGTPDYVDLGAYEFHAP